MGDELADAMGNADLLGASRTSQQRRNTTYPGPDEDLTAWKTQVEIALRGITDPKTKLTLDQLLVERLAAAQHSFCSCKSGKMANNLGRKRSDGILHFAFVARFRNLLPCASR